MDDRTGRARDHGQSRLCRCGGCRARGAGRIAVVGRCRRHAPHRRDGLLSCAGAAVESAGRLCRSRVRRPTGLCRPWRLCVVLSHRRAECERVRRAADRRSVRGTAVDPGFVRGVSAARRVFCHRHLGRLRGVRAVGQPHHGTRRRLRPVVDARDRPADLARPGSRETHSLSHDAGDLGRGSGSRLSAAALAARTGAHGDPRFRTGVGQPWRQHVPHEVHHLHRRPPPAPAWSAG